MSLEVPPDLKPLFIYPSEGRLGVFDDSHRSKLRHELHLLANRREIAAELDRILATDARPFINSSSVDLRSRVHYLIQTILPQHKDTPELEFAPSDKDWNKWIQERLALQKQEFEVAESLYNLEKRREAVLLRREMLLRLGSAGNQFRVPEQSYREPMNVNTIKSVLLDLEAMAAAIPTQ